MRVVGRAGDVDAARLRWCADVRGEVETERVVVIVDFVLVLLVGLVSGGCARVNGGSSSDSGTCGTRGVGGSGARKESASWWSAVGMSTSGGMKPL